MSFGAGALRLRLFLEGQEVPIISASVQGGVNQPCTASIQIVPTADVHNLLPRTLVHVFFYDLYPSDDATDALQNADEHGYRGVSKEDQEVLGNNYRLLFAGELVAYSFGKTDGNRTAVIKCLDFSSYWDSAKLFFHTGTGSTARNAAFSGATSLEFGDTKRTTPTQAVLKILNQKPAVFPGLQGLLGGIVHLLESIGGVYKGPHKFRGLNDFFSSAELRLHLTQMLGASPHDTSSKYLFNHKSFRKWVRMTLSRSRNLISFRQVVELLMAKIYHEYVSIPAPAFKGNRTVKVTKFKAGKILVKDTTKALIKRRLSQLNRYLAAVGTVKGLSSDQILAAETKERARQKTPSNLSGGRDIIDAIIADATAGDKLDAACTADRLFITALQSSSKNNPPSSNGTATLTRRAKDARTKYRRALGARASGSSYQGSAQALERMPATIFRPNIYFCAAPRCNVIWPDMYTSFSYSRNYLQEVTRLQLIGQKEWKRDSALDLGGGKKKKYWAPNVETMATRVSSTSDKNGTRFLMKHEILTGIIPKFEKLPDISAFQKVDRAQGGRNKIPYLQRIANYDFFLARYGPRTAQVSMYFNPYLATGMPVVVIDKYRNDSVRESLGLKATQYLGMLQSVSHAVSQSGGITMAHLAYCRTHNEREDALGEFVKSVRKPTGSSVSSLVALAADITVDNIGENAAPFVSNVKLTDSKLGKLAGSDQLSADPSALIGRRIPQGVIEHVNYSAPSGLGLNSSGQGTGASGVSVKVRRTLYETVKVKLPAEKVLFPGWMSPIYSNLNIGRMFYQEMFGVGSICDPVQIGSTDRKVGMDGIPYIPDTVTAKAANSLSASALKDMANKAKPLFVTNAAGEGPPALSAAKSSEVAAEVELGATVEQAVDALANTYQALKEGGHDLSAFFKAYSWRPVATLRQVMGSPDYDPDPQKAENALASGLSLLSSSAAPNLSLLGGGAPTSIGNLGVSLNSGPAGEKGFHSLAFGNYKDMEHLDHPSLAYVNGKGGRKRVDGQADPRAIRHAKVAAYIAVLEADKGALG